MSSVFFYKAVNKSFAVDPVFEKPNIIRQPLFNRFEKKKKVEELEQSLNHLDKVVKEMIVPVEF